METLWMTLGSIFLPIGFSLMAVAYAVPPQANNGLALLGLAMGLIGILVMLQAYRLANRKENLEDKKFMYTAELTNTMINELKITNSNISSLLDEIRKERDEQNKPKPKVPDNKST